MKKVIVNSQTNEVEIIDVDDSGVENIAIFRDIKRAELNSRCELEITTPYKSNIIISSSGMSHRYSTDRDDQRNMDVKLNIIYNTPSILIQPWKTKDDGIVYHTRDEFIAITLEIVDYIEQKLFKCIGLKMQLDAATTVEEIEAIVWK